jgi:hypothetical protein
MGFVCDEQHSLAFRRPYDLTLSNKIPSGRISHCSTFSYLSPSAAGSVKSTIVDIDKAMSDLSVPQ